MSDFEIEQPKNKKRVASPALPPEAPAEEVKENVVDEPVKPKYDSDELLRIFDEMIFAGEYSEVVNIRGKLKVGFRTRSAEETEAITKQIDGTTANLIATLNEKRSLLNLQYAITSYQGNDLSAMKPEEKAKFVNRLPTPVVGALMMALAKFDDKIFAASREGEENF